MKNFIFAFVALCTVITVNCCHRPKPTVTTTTTPNPRFTLDTCLDNNIDPILDSQTAINLIGINNQRQSGALTYRPAAGTNPIISCYTIVDILNGLGQGSAIEVTSGGVGTNSMTVSFTSAVGQGYGVSLIVRGK